MDDSLIRQPALRPAPLETSATYLIAAAVDQSLIPTTLAGLDGRLLYANRAALALWGYRSTDEVVGRGGETFWEDPAAAHAVVRLAADHGSWSGLARARRKDGTLVEVEISTTVFLDSEGRPVGLLASYLDVTGARRAERRYRQLFENAFNPIVAVDLEERFLDANRAFADLLGYSRDELIGMSALDLVVPDQHEHARSETARKLAGDTRVAVYEQTVRAKSGELLTLEIASCTLEEGGHVAGTMAICRDVTEVRRLEAERAHTEARYRRLFEQSTDAISIVDLDDRFVDVNPSLERLTGFTRDELVGRSVADISAASSSPDESRARTAEKLPDPGRITRFEYEIVGKEGHSAWLEMVTQLLLEDGEAVGVLAIGRDVSERRAIETRLRQSEERYRSVFENAREPIFTTDFEGRFLQVNPAFEQLIGYSADELLGMTLFDVTPPELHPFIRESTRRTVEGADVGQRFEADHVTRGGRRITLEVSTQLVAQDGVPLHIQTIGRDVTERNALQRQLAETRRLEALGTLAGGVAHDFNNVLAAILGNAELLLHDDATSPPTRERIGDILDATHRARELVRQILLFARAESEPRVPTDVTAVVRGVVSRFRTEAPEGISVTYVGDPDPLEALAIPSQLDRVVTNLCSNAVHAIRGGEGWIRVGVRKAGVDDGGSPDRPPGPYATISIEDSGGGMEPEVLERIFEPFFTTRRGGEGSGLGLSVVQGIVAAHEGTIGVESRLGEGTRFDVRLPLLAVSRETPETATTEEAAATARPARILFVDDEPAIARVSTRLLGAWGHDVHSETDPEAALAAFAADPVAFDIVLCDYNMPGRNGLDLARDLVALRPDVPIVLLSGFFTEDVRDAASALGVRALLDKPAPLAAIARTIADIVGEAPQTLP